MYIIVLPLPVTLLNLLEVLIQKSSTTTVHTIQNLQILLLISFVFLSLLQSRRSTVHLSNGEECIDVMCVMKNTEWSRMDSDTEQQWYDVCYEEQFNDVYTEEFWLNSL